MHILILTLLLLFAGATQAESFESHCGEGSCAAYGIEISQTSVEILDRDEDGTRFRNAEGVERWASRRGKRLLFATNAGIFDKAFRPLGLFIRDGKQIVPINTSSGDGNFFAKPNGIFYVSGTEGHIVETSLFKPDVPISLATQSGPLLLQNGVINSNFQHNSNNRKVRSGVGVQSRNKIYFVISNEGINFFDFASFFKENLHCTDALYLDGVISKAFIPEIGRDQKDGDFAAMLVVIKE